MSNMIRYYSRKYFCPVCKQEKNKLVRLYSEKNEHGEKTLNCKYHGFQQYCNCSPSELELVIEDDE